MTRPLVVVLSGGTACRLGGVDKTALDVGGRPVLHRLLDDLRPWPTVVVGPARGIAADVLRTREQPPGGGPLAGVAAGAAAGRTAHTDIDVLVVLAGDQPFAGAAVPALLAALDDPQADAALAAGPDGRPQPLLAAYRWTAVGARLGGDVRDRPARDLLTDLRTVVVEVDATTALDVDDAADLAAARAAVAATRTAPRPGPDGPAGQAVGGA